MHAALWIAAIAAVLLATGVLYERIGDWRDRRRYAGSWQTASTLCPSGSRTNAP